jgi:hypothetical protein
VNCHHGTLPDTELPPRRSLTDLIIRKLTANWDVHRDYDRYYLYALPSETRAALISYLSLYGQGVTVSDLQLILAQPPELADVPDAEHVDTSTLNGDFTSLDLCGALGKSISLRELTNCLFPTHGREVQLEQAPVTESWDDSADKGTSQVIPGLLSPLLPRLTHLSLALIPASEPSTDPQKMLNSRATVSWKHLLSLAQHFPTLTHLSLAYWPEPSLTPNSKLAAMTTSHGLRVSLAGTGPYSHSLDHDWSEAILVLRRLSKLLYSLEYLDLTGCSGWWTALLESADHDAVDWSGDWGKMTEVVMEYGYGQEEDSLSILVEAAIYLERRKDAGRLAARVERHIRTKRAGRGRRIEVTADSLR